VYILRVTLCDGVWSLVQRSARVNASHGIDITPTTDRPSKPEPDATLHAALNVIAEHDTTRDDATVGIASRRKKPNERTNEVPNQLDVSAADASYSTSDASSHQDGQWLKTHKN